jgi:tetratricopeptide (TPR) repeat protein
MGALIFIIAFGLSFSSGFAQTRQDSLTHFYTIAVDRGDEPFKLHETVFIKRHRPSLLVASNRSIIKLLSHGDSIKAAGEIFQLGLVLEGLGNTEDALKKYVMAIRLLEQSMTLTHLNILYCRAGILYFNKGRYDTAIHIFSKQLSLLERKKASSGIDDVYYHLSRLYYQLGDTLKAADFLTRSLAMKRKANDSDVAKLLIYKTLVFPSNTNLGSHNPLDSLEKSTYLDDFEQMLCSLVKGKMLYKLGRKAEAEAMFDSAISHSRVFEVNPYALEAKLYKAIVLTDSRAYARGTAILKSVETLSNAYKFNEILLEVYNQFIRIYATMKDYDRLSTYQDRYIQQKDKMYGEELLVKISEMETEFEVRDEVNKIAGQKELMELQEQTLQQKRYINVAIGAVVFMLLVILKILYGINMRKRAFNRNLDSMVQERTIELEEKRLELAQQSRELELRLDTMYRQLKGEVSTLEGMIHLAKAGEPSISEDDVAEIEKALHEMKHQMAVIKEFRVRGFTVDEEDKT